MVSFLTQEPEISVPADVKTLMLTFALPPMEAKFLRAMLDSRAWVGKDELPEVRYSIRQVIFKLRAKLDPLHIWVVNDGAGKYSIPPSSKIIAKNLIERHMAAPRVSEGA